MLDKIINGFNSITNYKKEDVQFMREFFNWLDVYFWILSKLSFIIIIAVVVMIVDRLLLHKRLHDHNNALECHLNAQPEKFEELHSKIDQSEIKSEIKEIRKHLKTLKQSQNNPKRK